MSIIYASFKVTFFIIYFLYIATKAKLQKKSGTIVYIHISPINNIEK